MTSSRMSHTTGSSLSTSFLALFTVWTWPFSSSFRMMKGLKSSSAIVFGRPHWCSFSSGPTTMTERPE